MSLLNHLTAPLTNKTNLITILLVVILFASYRISVSVGGADGVSIRSVAPRAATSSSVSFKDIAPQDDGADLIEEAIEEADAAPRRNPSGHRGADLLDDMLAGAGEREQAPAAPADPLSEIERQIGLK